MDEKRLFLGFSLKAPWNDSFPSGKILKQEDRHLTVVFLGSCDYEKALSVLEHIPMPMFSVTPVGVFDELIFLPKNSKKVAAFHAKFFDDRIKEYQRVLYEFCIKQNLIDSTHIEKGFLPHVTIARSLSSIEDWKKSFSPHPFYLEDLCLYESLGNSTFNILWKKAFIPPIEELSHTADIAYIIRAKDRQTLYQNAQIALCFADENILSYLDHTSKVENLDDIIIHLNQIVSEVDADIGSAFKAVSFHGRLKEEENHITWEMVIDV